MGLGRAQLCIVHPARILSSVLLSLHLFLTPGSWSLICHLLPSRLQTSSSQPFPSFPSLPPSTFLLIPRSWSGLHSSALNLILLFPVPYFLNSPGPFSFISPSSLVLFAALPSLLSSADLISVVDDPSLPDRRLRGGMGGSRQGRLYSICAQGHGCGRACFGCVEGTCSKLGSHLI